MAKQAFGGKKGSNPFAQKGSGNPFAKKGDNPFVKDTDGDAMKKGGRVKKAAGGIIKGGTGAGAPNGNTWKHNDSPKKPFGATNNRMKKGGKVC